MSDNWVVQNLQNSLDTWNEKLSEVWKLLTESPQQFKGGGIWDIILNIHGALMAIGLALLVLFFVVGVVKTCGSFAELRKAEHAVELFIRFAIAKGVVTYGLELMMALFEIVQGVISTIMKASGLGANNDLLLPKEMITAIEDCGFFESIPLWAVTLIGRRSHYSACLHYLFRVCGILAGCRCGRSSGNHGMELCWRTDF